MEARQLAQAAKKFVASNNGCIPQKPMDVMKPPSAERMKELGCINPGTGGLDYAADGRDLLKRMDNFSFVRRWDGLYVIQWTEVRKDLVSKADLATIQQCTFLGADKGKCEGGGL